MHVRTTVESSAHMHSTPIYATRGHIMHVPDHKENACVRRVAGWDGDPFSLKSKKPSCVLIK